MTEVESALRVQRELWREIIDRVPQTAARELPIEAPKRILLFGLGSSLYAARLIAWTLLRDRSRLRVPVVACSSLSVGLDVTPQRGDWAFAITHRGSPGPTLNALEACDRVGAFTVLVSGKGVSAPDTARLAVETSPLEKCEPHTMSMTGAICAITSMLMGPKAQEEWEALRSIGEPDLDHLRNLVGEGPAVLLGEWEAYWLAREGALKLMEMARLPVRAFGSEDFFHGPRFSVKPDDRIWHISMPKDPRNDQIKADHRIDIFGASPLAWVPALVQLQWLSLATALNLGVNPDDPRADQ